MTIEPSLIPIIITVGSLLVGGGAAYARLKTRDEEQQKKIDAVNLHIPPCKELLEFKNIMSETTGEIKGDIKEIMVHLTYLRHWAENGGNNCLKEK